MLDTYRKLLQDTLSFTQESAAGSFVLGHSSETQFFSKATKKPIILKTAVRDGKVMPFDSESCITLPSPIAVPRMTIASFQSMSKADNPGVTPTQLKTDSSGPKPQSKESSHLEIKRTLQKIAPRLYLIDQIPDDALAQRLASAWKERIKGVDVVVLVLEQSDEEMLFIKNLAKAIHSELLPTRIITGGRLEQENRWDLFLEKNAFRLIIASSGIQNYPNLLRHSQDQLFLGKTPFIALSPAAVYNQAKEEKATLWKKVCQILKNPPPVLPPSS